MNTMSGIDLHWKEGEKRKNTAREFGAAVPECPRNATLAEIEFLYTHFIVKTESWTKKITAKKCR
jgi:hypothetical protein